MHRESDRHPPRADDEPKAEPPGNGPADAGERRDPELPADGEPDVPPLGGGA